MAIPVIDFSKLEGKERAETLARIANGCQEWGFFQVCIPFDRFLLCPYWDLFELTLVLKQRNLPDLFAAGEPWDSGGALGTR